MSTEVTQRTIERFLAARSAAITTRWRLMGERIHLMSGWTEAVTLSNHGTRWDANKLGELFATDLFEMPAPGLRLGG